MIATIGDKDSSPGRGSCSPSQFVTIIIITITTTNIMMIINIIFIIITIIKIIMIIITNIMIIITNIMIIILQEEGASPPQSSDSSGNVSLSPNQASS